MATANPPVGGVNPAAPVPASEVPEPLEDRAALHTDHRGLLTFGVMAATIMQILDTTIANVALPHMEASMVGVQRRAILQRFGHIRGGHRRRRTRAAHSLVSGCHDRAGRR